MNRITVEKKEIGRRIRALRITCCMDQETLAKRACVSRGSISAYERGVNRPKMAVAKALAKALGVELHEVIPMQLWDAVREHESTQQAASLKHAHERRRETARICRAEKEADEAQPQPAPENQPAWMEEARRAAKERAKRDEQRTTVTRTRRKRREPEPEPGATSGFISDAELAGIPEFLHEVIIDQHIRRRLFLCGEYGRRENVKKTRTPMGVAWSAEETA